MRAVQPFFEVTVSRPWHWGIAILSAPDAEIPEQLDAALVTGSPGCLVVKVRHAQDIDADVFEGDWDWATATLHLRSVAHREEPTGAVLYEGILELPDGRLTVGDADSEVVLNDLPKQVRVLVQSDAADSTGLTTVRVDLAHE